MKITAKLNPNRPGFRCTFRDPRTGKSGSYGLATRDAERAQEVCDDIAAIFADPALFNCATNPKLKAFHPRAIEIVHKITLETTPRDTQTTVLTDASVLTELRRQKRATEKLIAVLEGQKKSLQHTISKIEVRK